MKLWKYSGTILSVTGLIHIMVAIISEWNIYKEIMFDGLLNSIGNNLQKAFSFWFLIIGFLLIMFGQTLQYYIKKTGTSLPISFGYSLLILSLSGSLIVPISGFWLFIPQALIIIFATRGENKSM